LPVLESFSSRNRTTTVILLVASALLAVAASVRGIDDDALGISLLLLAGASFVLAFTHARRTPAQYRIVIYAAVIAFAALVVLGVGLQMLGERAAVPDALTSVFEFVGTAFLLSAGFLCIPALAVGLIGVIVKWTRQRRDQRAA
jgi:hypothetical protein